MGLAPLRLGLDLSRREVLLCPLLHILICILVHILGILAHELALSVLGRAPLRELLAEDLEVDNLNRCIKSLGLGESHRLRGEEAASVL